MAENYEASGVSLQAGYEVVNRIKPLVASTRRKGCMGGIGAFGGMFDLGELKMRNPVLVSGTDGVGTKLKLAFAMNRHDTVGIDAVAMCVNDILAQGAEPLFFLDYVAVGKNEPEVVESIVAGVAEGCRQAGCALIGGETAEMPGMYPDGEYDIAGFSVGAVEKDCLIDGSSVEDGDLLLALPSSGVHSNGFSLVRKIIADNNLDFNKIYPELDPEKTLGDILLTPTRIYVKPVLEVLRHYKVDAIAHITGGGFYENIPRIIPDGLMANIDVESLVIPPVFLFLAQKGHISLPEMFNVFNMGVGMVLAVKRNFASEIIETLKREGEAPFLLGYVSRSENNQKILITGI